MGRDVMGFAQNFATAPSAAFGSYRVRPCTSAPDRKQGGTVAGNGQFAAGQGPVESALHGNRRSYTCSGLILVEMSYSGFLSKHLG